jgi:hypothetical protein
MNHTCKAPIEENDLWLLLIIRRVTVKWETAKARIFPIETWKWHQNGKKMCSGNPTFLRSITWNPLYLVSVSWHYPFKLFSFEESLCILVSIPSLRRTAHDTESSILATKCGAPTYTAEGLLSQRGLYANGLTHFNLLLRFRFSLEKLRPLSGQFTIYLREPSLREF